MEKNKTGQYIKYAIGEIVLVVIGILIALQINNWNEDRLTRIQIKKNLINLSEAIKKDYNLLNQIEINNEFRYISIYQVLKWAEIPLRELDTFNITLSSKSVWEEAIPKMFNPEFFRKTIIYIGRPRVMIVQTYAIEELKSTGLYSQLDNQNLKNLLNEYYTGMNWFFGKDLTNNNDSSLYNYVRDKYNIKMDDLSLMNEPIELIKNDPGIIVRLRDVISDANWRKLGASTSKMRAEELLNELNLEIKKY
jgi:hypothetical protein